MSIENIKTGYAYVRVSTDKQEELSPDAQVRLIKEYASKNGIILSEIFIENGISGRKAEKRPQFMNMIAKVKDSQNQINVILVWKFSRFARNQEESIVYKSILKKQHNIDVVSISEPLIDGPFGSLIERIIEWMDEYYSIRLSGEVIRGMTENALRGGYQSKPPFGYRMNSKEIPTIEPKEANAVRYVFDKYTNERMSSTDITRWLNDSGFRTTRGNLFDSRGVRYMLENPFYTGLLRWNYTSRGRTVKEEEDWIIAEGKHSPIIDRDMWNRTQEELKKRIRPYRQRSVSTCRHWLSGMLICSSCGRSLGFNSAKNQYGHGVGFQCWGYAKGLCKDSHGLSESKAIAAVIDGLEEYLQSDGFFYEILLPVEDLPDKEKILRDKILDIQKKEDRIKEAYRNGVDTLDEYKANKAILMRERISLTKEIENLPKKPPRETESAEKSKVIQSVVDVLTILKSPDYDYVKKGNALRSICRKIIFDKEKNHMEFDIAISL